MDKGNKLPCLALYPGDIHERVIVCGDPARAEKISKLLDDPVCLAQNREFWSYSGSWNGVGVTVVSHGVGCGGASILFESLWRAGAKVIIRVGTCGGMQPGIDAGSIVIATAACREDGVTDKMVYPSYPAVADIDVINSLVRSAKANAVPVQVGIVLTQALFYKSKLESKVKFYADCGVKAMENEVASLLVVASLNGVKAGAIIAADAPAFELVDVEGYAPDQDIVYKAINDQIKIALDAIIEVPLEEK